MQTPSSVSVDFLATLPQPTQQGAAAPNGAQGNFSHHLNRETAKGSKAPVEDQAITHSSPQLTDALPANSAEQIQEVPYPEALVNPLGASIPQLSVTNTQHQLLVTSVPSTSAAPVNGVAGKEQSAILTILENLTTPQASKTAENNPVVPSPLADLRLASTSSGVSVTNNPPDQNTGVAASQNNSGRPTTPITFSISADYPQQAASQANLEAGNSTRLATSFSANQMAVATQQPQAQSSSQHITQQNSSATVIIDQWSATYSQDMDQPGQPINQLTGSTAAQSPKPGESVLQTDSGQIITIYRSSDQEEMAVSAPVAGRSAVVDQSGQRQDTNSNYIHSNLPNNTVKTSSGTEGDQKAGANAEQQDNTSSLQAAKELSTDPRAPKETATQPFSLDTAAPVTTPQTTATTSPTTPGLLRLPSGGFIQDSAVMDQVINHLSFNKKLESGSIRLQLHPQELGEIRMEIEVKQENVKAHIITQNPQAQEALDRHLPRLRETLEQQGLHLGEIEITVSAGDQYDGQRYQENEARHQLGRSYRPGLGQSPPPVSTETAGTDEIREGGTDAQQSLSITV